MKDTGKLPVHVSIIMDGNGRWAKLQGKERLFGHRAGADSVRACTEAAAEMGIKYLSLFAFSSENWNRPADEVAGLMELMIKSLMAEQKNFMDNDIRLRVIGDRSRLSAGLLDEIEKVEAMTSGNSRMTLIIFLSYSGKWDLVQAARKYAEKYAEARISGTVLPEIDENSFDEYLSTAGIPDPDLLIRTSGEQRISNYLLWQCAYTEFYFTEIMWPDFRKEEFRKAVEAFSRRDRRYGKVR